MIKVFNVKDLIKYFIKITIPLIAIFVIAKVLFSINNVPINLEYKTAKIYCLDDNIPQINNKKNEKVKSTQTHKFLLAQELNILKGLQNNKNIISENNGQNEQDIVQEKPVDNNTEEKEIEQAKTGVKVEVVENNVKPRSTNEYKGVKINNSTSYTLTEDMLNPDGIEINKSKIGIYHTHTCESYTPSENYNYEMTGNFRTTDLNYSVVRVGDELEKQLKSYNIDVVHDKTLHDYPAYSGSYSRSLLTAEGMLRANNDIDIMFDLHRDAIADATYAPKVKIGDEYASQIMFVIGSDGANKIHSNWNANLKFAVKVQQKANELYPRII